MEISQKVNKNQPGSKIGFKWG